MKSDSQTRPYRQIARARAAADTARRITASFLERMEHSWFDEIRLEDIAQDAGVTVQTVLRRFGSKEGLLAAGQAEIEQNIMQGREVAVGDVAGALDVLIAEYETLGGLVIRLLAQEDRYAPIKATTDLGRAHHRKWVETTFSPWLDRIAGPARTHMLDRLVIAMDIYVWKLLRIDMRRGRKEVRQCMFEMCAEALGVDPESLESAGIT